MVARCAEKASYAVSLIKEKVMQLESAHWTEDGIQNYLTVMSYVGTAKKHGKNAYEAIQSIFNNNWSFAFN